MRSARFAGLVTLILVVVGLYASAHPANAKGINCYGLKDKDCKILSAAEDNLGQLTSFNYDFDMTAKLNAGISVGSGTMNAKGRGVVAVDPARSANTQDQAAVLDGIKMTMDVEGTLTVNSPSTSLNQKGSASLVLLDGIIYTNTDQTIGWTGQSLSAFLAANSSSPFSGQNADPAAAAFFQDPDVLKAMGSVQAVKGFIKLTRTANAPVLDGQKQVEFVYTFDVQTLINTKQMVPVLRALLKASGMAVQFTDAQMADLARALARSLTGTSLKVTRWIGSKDNLYHALIVDFTLRYDPRTLGVTTQPSVRADFHFAVRLTKIGQPVKVEAPEDVQMQDEATSTPTATSSPTVTPTATAKPSRTPTATVAPSKTPMPTRSPSDSPTRTTMPSPAPSATNTSTLAPSDTVTLTAPIGSLVPEFTAAK